LVFYRLFLLSREAIFEFSDFPSSIFVSFHSG
jgi:hypothetical protein